MIKNYSIIVVTLNNSNGLLKTLKSIRTQSFINKEVVVIDGGSTDRTMEIIEDNADIISKYISEKDAGIYNAMNKGIKLAINDYIIFMNAGDCFYNNTTLEYVSNLSGDIILGGTIYGSQYRFPPSSITLFRLFSEGICHQSTYYRREIIQKYPFDESYKILADLKSVIQPYISDRINITSFCEIFSLCEGNGVSQKHWRAIYNEREKVISDCVDSFYKEDYLMISDLNHSMIKDFKIISRFDKLTPIIKTISKVASLINKRFKKIPL